MLVWRGLSECGSTLLEKGAEPFFRVWPALAKCRGQAFGKQSGLRRHGGDLGYGLNDEAVDGARVFGDAFGQFEGLGQRGAFRYDIVTKPDVAAFLSRIDASGEHH